MDEDARMIREFVDGFEHFDDLTISRGMKVYGDVSPILTAAWGVDNQARWRPLAVQTSTVALEDFYKKVPRPLPALYEKLILSYRWAEVDVRRFRLLSNLPPGLQGLAEAVTADPVLFRVLSDGRFAQFGKGPDMDYDPICFDLTRRGSDGDCPIVKFDHEEILNNQRLVVVDELAPTFRRLVELVVGDARQKPGETAS